MQDGPGKTTLQVVHDTAVCWFCKWCPRRLYLAAALQPLRGKPSILVDQVGRGGPAGANFYIQGQFRGNRAGWNEGTGAEPAAAVLFAGPSCIKVSSKCPVLETEETDGGRQLVHGMQIATTGQLVQQEALALSLIHI